MNGLYLKMNIPAENARRPYFIRIISLVLFLKIKQRVHTDIDKARFEIYLSEGHCSEEEKSNLSR